MPKAVQPEQEQDVAGVVRQYLVRYSVGTGPVLVAVSGGPDSTALLLACVEVLGSTHVHAAHLNHQLRGAESDADEQFVRSLCEQLGVSLCVERRYIGELARASKDNLESVARRQRYAWLAETARDRQIAWLATGHTANDQAETVLFRLLRGCGLRGLRGIASCRRLDQNVCLLRPLLSVKRDAVEAFLRARGISARQDSSNLDLRRTRNRIRWQLLPLLQREYNPQIVEHLCTLAAQVEEYYDWFERQAYALLQTLELPRLDTNVVLDAEKVRQADPVLLRQALRVLWEREGWPSRKMTARHWRRLAEFLRSPGHAMELPDGIYLRRRLHTWVFACTRLRESRPSTP
ncbi:tRNA(Ile)-lysidine synthase [bacterium HR36]|nr:tRNA(Ile)-lysidine synthase [bacterium HR36]